jgi:large subunit ribosomal protein L13
VVVINAEKVVLTGNKWSQKMYHHHTGFPGGIKSVTAKEVQSTHPDRLVKLAVYRMLPKGKGHRVRQWFKRLKVYAGAEHPHLAQKPETIKLPYGATH